MPSRAQNLHQIGQYPIYRGERLSPVRLCRKGPPSPGAGDLIPAGREDSHANACRPHRREPQCLAPLVAEHCQWQWRSCSTRPTKCGCGHLQHECRESVGVLHGCRPMFDDTPRDLIERQSGLQDCLTVSGSRFTFRLPRSLDPLSVSATAHSASHQTPGPFTPRNGRAVAEQDPCLVNGSNGAKAT
jgi:hypothetical protein